MWKDIDYLIKSHYFQRDYISEEELYHNGEVKKMQNDVIFNGVAYELYYDICEKLSSIAYGCLECIPQKYPLFLPKSVIERTQYFKKFPHHCIFCCDVGNDFMIFKDKSLHNNFEISEYQDNYMKLSDYVMSPSACYHVYEEYKNSELEDEMSISFIHNVCRNESFGNHGCELGRLRSYNVREFVFLGSEEYVKGKLKQTETLIYDMLCDFGLAFCINRATDSFIMPEEETIKAMQLISDVKHEFRVGISDEKSLAIGSVNYHAESFSYPFSISMKNINRLVTGCVGVGIERLAIAYMMQHREYLFSKRN